MWFKNFDWILQQWIWFGLLYASFLVEQDYNDFLDNIDVVAVVEEAGADKANDKDLALKKNAVVVVVNSTNDKDPPLKNQCRSC